MPYHYATEQYCSEYEWNDMCKLWDISDWPLTTGQLTTEWQATTHEHRWVAENIKQARFYVGAWGNCPQTSAFPPKASAYRYKEEHSVAFIISQNAFSAGAPSQTPLGSSRSSSDSPSGERDTPSPHPSTPRSSRLWRFDARFPRGSLVFPADLELATVLLRGQCPPPNVLLLSRTWHRANIKTRLDLFTRHTQYTRYPAVYLKFLSTKIKFSFHSAKWCHNTVQMQWNVLLILQHVQGGTENCTVSSTHVDTLVNLAHVCMAFQRRNGTSQMPKI